MTRFRNRTHAGEQLAERVARLALGKVAVLAIPRGGVEVGLPVARELGASLSVMVLRKLPLPTSPEAGFGAITLDGTMILNDDVVERARLDTGTIYRVQGEVLAEMKRRADRYADYVAGKLDGREAVIVDDGLASGYTMLAATASARSRGAAGVTVAVPVSSQSAYEAVAEECDRFVALVVSPQTPFAVAGFYEHWEDLTDEEALASLRAASGGENASHRPSARHRRKGRGR